MSSIFIILTFFPSYLLTDRLIITTSRIAVLTARTQNARPKAHSGMELLVFMSYNSVFDCLITVGDKSSVGIWDPESYSLIHEYKEAHVASDKEGMHHVKDITAATLDPSERRLATAGKMIRINWEMS